MEGKDLAFDGDDLRLVDDKSRDGVRLVVGQVPVVGAVHVADRHGAVDQIGTVLGPGDDVVVFLVELVGDLAHDLLDDVFQRDKALQRAVFVHHQREMGLAAQELAHLVVEGRRLGDEIGRLGHVHDVDPGQRIGTVGVMGVDRAQQILGVDHADDVFRIVAVERQAGVRGFERLAQDVGGGLVGVDHLDPRAVEHHLLDRTVREVERAQDAVAVLLLDHAFGMAELQGTGDLLAHGEDVAVGIGAHPEDVKHAAHEVAHRRHDGREDQNHELDRAGDEGRGGFGVGDGVGLGQHLREDQHQKRHHQRGDGDAVLAEDLGQQGGGKRGRQNVDHVVAQQDGTDQPLAVLGHVERLLRALAAPVGGGAQFPARGGGQRGFGAREEARHHQQHEDPARRQPEGRIEKRSTGRGGVHDLPVLVGLGGYGAAGAVLQGVGTLRASGWWVRTRSLSASSRTCV